MHCHIASSRVWVHGNCLFTGVGEWVVSSENETKSKVETHEGVK